MVSSDHESRVRVHRQYPSQQSYFYPLDGYLSVDNTYLKRRCLFTRVYTPTGFKTTQVKDESYRNSSGLLQIVPLMDTVLVAGELNAQRGCSVEAERHKSGRFPIPVNCTDNSYRLIRFIPTTDCFWGAQTFAIKNDMSSVVALLRLHNIRIRLTSINLVNRWD